MGGREQSYGYIVSHQLEGEAARGTTAPDRVQEPEFLFNTKDNWQSLWGIRIRIWLNNLKNGHLMGHHAVAF